MAKAQSEYKKIFAMNFIPLDKTIWLSKWNTPLEKQNYLP